MGRVGNCHLFCVPNLFHLKLSPLRSSLEPTIGKPDTARKPPSAKLNTTKASKQAAREGFLHTGCQVTV